MKINEILSEGYYDDNVTSTNAKDIFIKRLTTEIHDYIASFRKTNQPLDMMSFVDSYMSKYGWQINPQQEVLLSNICKKIEYEYDILRKKEQTQQPDQQAQQPAQQPQQTGPIEPTLEPMQEAFADTAKQLGGKIGAGIKNVGSNMLRGIGNMAISGVGKLLTGMNMGPVVELANAMYIVGQQQRRDSKTGIVLSPNTQQLMRSLKNIKGQDYEDDLQEIIKLALWNLHGTDKADYSDFVKQIMSKKAGTANPAQQTQNNQP